MHVTWGLVFFGGGTQGVRELLKIQCAPKRYCWDRDGAITTMSPEHTSLLVFSGWLSALTCQPHSASRRGSTTAAIGFRYIFFSSLRCRRKTKRGMACSTRGIFYASITCFGFIEAQRNDQTKRIRKQLSLTSTTLTFDANCRR